MLRQRLGISGLFVCVWACGEAQPATPDVAETAIAAAETQDAADTDAVFEVLPVCPAGEERCEGACVPVCPTATARKFAPDCRCWDESKVAGLPPSASTTALDAGRGFCLAMQLPLDQGQASKARRQQIFSAAQYLGVRAIRTDVRWDEIEPQKGKFDWTTHDTLVGELHAHGIELLALLAYGNTWASKEGKAANDIMYPPDDPQDFANFAAAVAQRYQGKVKRYEIWNEQNAGFRFWKGTNSFSGDPKAYAKLLLAAADAIHGADASAEVGFGGLFYLPQAILGAEDFTFQAYTAVPGLKNAVDALAWHPYSFYPPVDPPEHAASKQEAGVERVPVDQTAHRLRKILQGFGAKAQQRLWMTELGWPTEDAVSETDHARFLVRSWALLDGADVPYRCWYTWMDHPPDAQNVIWEKVFGLYRWDADPADAKPPAPKPAALAWHAMARRLAQTAHVSRFDGAVAQRSTARREALYVDVYAGSSVAVGPWPSSVRVLWDETVPEGQTAAASLVARKGRRYRLAQLLDDPDTTTAPEVPPDAQNRIQFQIGRSPVYLIETPQ